MATSRKLSAEEVDALVGGLMDFDQNGESSTEGGAQVRSFSFGSKSASYLGDYYGLRVINERFCRIARSVFFPMIRIQPRISSFPPESKTFDEYRDGVENFVSLTTSRVEELRGSALLMIPPDFISLLTEAYFGGVVRNQVVSRNEFTATEHRVIEIISDGLNQALQSAWRDLAPLSFVAQTREENLQFASFVDGKEMVVNCSFMLQLPDAEPASFDILYPLQTLKPLSAQLRSRLQSDHIDDDISWRNRLEEAVLGVPLPVTARLAEPKVPLRNLMELKSGKVMEIPLPGSVDVLVADQRMFDASLGEVGGQSAVRLTKRYQRKSV